MNLIDQLNHVNLEETCQVSFKVIDALQDDKPGVQVAASAILFLLMCRKNSLDPRKALEVAGNVIADGLIQNNMHLNALRHYLKEDIGGDTQRYF